MFLQRGKKNVHLNLILALSAGRNEKFFILINFHLFFILILSL